VPHLVRSALCLGVLAAWMACEESVARAEGTQPSATLSAPEPAPFSGNPSVLPSLTVQHRLKDGEQHTLIWPGRFDDTPLGSVEELRHAHTITLSGKGTTGPWLRRLAALTHPTRVVLTGTDHTDSALCELRDLPVEQIALFSTDVTQAGLAQLARLPRLRRLDIYGTAISEATLALLVHIEELHLAQVTPSPSGGLSSLRALKHLEVRRHWPVELFSEVASLPLLETLEIEDDDFGGPELGRLRGSPLVRLAISRSDIGDGDLAHLAALPRLRHLTLAREVMRKSRITDEGLRTIGRLTELRTLIIRNADNITDLAPLRGLHALEQLDLAFSMLSDTAADTLVTMKALRRLDLWGTRLHDEGLAKLGTLSLLTELSIGYSGVSGVGVRQLARLSNLEVLSLGVALGDDDLQSLGAYPKLRHLTLVRAQITKVDRLVQIAPQLQTLHLDGRSMTNTGLRGLGRLQSLRELYLDCPLVSDDSVPTLLRLTHLESLNVVPTHISERGGKKLRKAFPRTDLYCPG